MLGAYLCNGDAAHLPSAATYYLLAYYVGSDRVLQYATRANDGAVYTRCNNNGTWTSWSRIDNYGTTSLEGLASALGGTLGILDNINASTDLDDLHENKTISKVYCCTGTLPANYPDSSIGNGVIINLSRATVAGGMSLQIVLGATGIAIRSYYLSVTGWSNWKKVLLA